MPLGPVPNDLLGKYREWASVFSEEEVNKLPEHGPWDHEIKLVEGTAPPFGRYTSSVGKDSKFYGIISSPKRDRPFPTDAGNSTR